MSNSGQPFAKSLPIRGNWAFREAVLNETGAKKAYFRESDELKGNIKDICTISKDFFVSFFIFNCHATLL